MKKFNKYGAEHQQKAQLFNKLVGPTPPTPAEQLLIEQVNDNLKFLLKVKPMNEKNIKDFILLCISMRIDVSKHKTENIQKIVNNVYNNLEISK